MSLIESALEKLRRAEAKPEARKSGPRTVGVTALVHASPPVVVPPEDKQQERLRFDADALRSAGYLPEAGMERRFADYYRRVKRPLIEKAFAGTAEMRLMLISSALPGDGKSFTSINLALSMAHERDMSVLLVDADGARARISEVLGIRRDPGLLDALAVESLDVESLVKPTDVRGLEILPAGSFAENATELIASGRMAQVAVRMTAYNPRRIILFDSAPLLVSSEARALTRLCGQIVLVVRAGVTPRRAMLEAVAQVDKSRLQGLIVNDARATPGEGYYYGYPSNKEVDETLSRPSDGLK
jgi:protein-tyrosine kinase